MYKIGLKAVENQSMYLVDNLPSRVIATDELDACQVEHCFPGVCENAELRGKL
jgi:hypothetical protein